MRGGYGGFVQSRLTLRLCWFSSDLRSCVKVEVAALGSPPLIMLMVSARVRKATLKKADFV